MALVMAYLSKTASLLLLKALQHHQVLQQQQRSTTTALTISGSFTASIITNDNHLLFINNNAFNFCTTSLSLWYFTLNIEIFLIISLNNLCSSLVTIHLDFYCMEKKGNTHTNFTTVLHVHLFKNKLSFTKK